MTEKMTASVKEDASESTMGNTGVKEDINESAMGSDAVRVQTVDIDNYHGLNAKTILVYLSICFIGFAQLMNIVAAGAFGRDIALAVGGSDKTIWLLQPLVIMTVVLVPPIGQAADFWGRKWFLVIPSAVGVVGLIIVSRCSSIGMAIAGQTLVGVSYGAQGLLYAVASEIVPRRFRPAAQGGLNAALAAGAIVALLGGEAMIRNYHEGFRVFYYFTTAILASATITIALLYNPPLRPLQKSLTLREKLGRLDWIGYALITLGITLFAIALSWAKNPYPWNSAHVLAPFFIGITIIAALAIQQTKFTRDGLFHHDLFKHDRNFALAFIIILIDGMAFQASNNYFAFEVSVLFETDPVRVGLRFAIVFFAAIASSFVCAIYSSCRKTVRGPIVLSFVLFTIFFALMSVVKTGSSKALWGYAVLLGLGLGLSLTCLVTAAQLSTPPQLISTSSGLVTASRSIGAVIALAIYQAEFSSGLNTHLGADIAAAVLPLGPAPQALPAFIGALAGNDQAALARIPGVTGEIIGAGVQGLQQAYLSTFRIVWITAAALSAVAVLLACCLKNPKDDFTMHVDAPLIEDSQEDLPRAV